MNNNFEKYLGIANHDIQMANTSQELKSYVASILYENDKKVEEIERLNNIINELEKYLIDKCKYIDENNPLANDKSYITYRTEQKLAYQCILDKLKELKDSDKE